MSQIEGSGSGNGACMVKKGERRLDRGVEKHLAASRGCMNPANDPQVVPAFPKFESLWKRSLLL